MDGELEFEGSDPWLIPWIEVEEVTEFLWNLHRPWVGPTASD